MDEIKVISVIVLSISFLYVTGLLWSILKLVLTISFSIAGLYLGIAYALNTNKKYRPDTKPHPVRPTTSLFLKMMEARWNYKTPEHKVTTTHNVDAKLQEMFELLVEEFVIYYVKDMAYDSQRIKELLIHDMWRSVHLLTERLADVDMVKLLTQDIVEAVTDQLEGIRKANVKGKGCLEHFLLHPWLANEQKEIELLHQLADLCALHLLPPEYTESSAAAHFSRELLTTCVFKPTIDMLCDPDYINQKLYNWLDYRENLNYEHRRRYTAAATYEEYMKIIEHCFDIEHLKQMRYNIMSEIIHATCIQNLKREKGMDTAKEMTIRGTSKGDLLRARNLPRYLNQLTICKQQCEKRIHFLGGPDYKSYESEDTSKMPEKVIISMSVIMESAPARQELAKFLKRTHNDSLLTFWEAVTDLKDAPMRESHHCGSRIYQMYITHPSSIVRLLIDRPTIKGMEAFLMGNTGPDAFFTAQQVVYSTIEEKHYPSFIISDIYNQLITAFKWKENDQKAVGQNASAKDSPRIKKRKNSVNSREKIEEHSTFAQEKLKKLDDKILNKTRALEALKSSQKPDPKILKIQEEMNTAIDSLKSYRRQLDFHIDRTELWMDNIGQWKANIYNHEIITEDKKQIPYFVIVISHAHLSSNAETQGWILTRKLEEFRLLHQQLYQIDAGFKQFKLPTNRQVKSRGEESVEKAKGVLQKYLNMVLSSSEVCQSEAVYAFFSPSPEHLKHSGSTRKLKGQFSLSSIFHRMDGEDSDDDEELQFADDDSSRELISKDSIAGPFYRLIQEVCEVKGVFKWFRRTFIIFVKVTFGRSVNRQLYSMIQWLYSEPMLIFYLDLFRDSYWPETGVRQPLVVRPQSEKNRTRYLAKTKMMSMMPEAVKNFVGDVNARRGAIKGFEAFQDVRLSKQLLYTIQELIIKEIIPEISQPQDDLIVLSL